MMIHPPLARQALADLQYLCERNGGHGDVAPVRERYAISIAAAQGKLGVRPILIGLSSHPLRVRLYQRWNGPGPAAKQPSPPSGQMTTNVLRSPQPDTPIVYSARWIPSTQGPWR